MRLAVLFFSLASIGEELINFVRMVKEVSSSRIKIGISAVPIVFRAKELIFQV